MERECWALETLRTDNGQVVGRKEMERMFSDNSVIIPSPILHVHTAALTLGGSPVQGSSASLCKPFTFAQTQGACIFHLHPFGFFHLMTVIVIAIIIIVAII